MSAAGPLMAQPAADTDTPKAGPAPKARCDKPVFEFGEVWAGTKITHAFVIHNDGDATLEITNVRAGCGCTATDYDRKIEPGQSGKVTAVLNTARQRSKIKKPVYVKTNDINNKRVTLILTGEVKQRISMTPPGGANWGRVTGKLINPVRVKLVNNTDEPMKLEPATPEAQDQRFKAAIEETEPGKVYEVVITPEPPFAEGSNSVRLSFNTGLEEEKRVIIPCRLYSPPALEVSPRAITLGAPPVRDMPRPVEIRYNGEGQLKVLGYEVSNEDIEAKLKELNPGQKYQIMLTLPAGWSLDAGQTAELTITTDDERNPKIVVPIRMRSHRRRVSPHRQSAEGMIGRTAPVMAAQTPEGEQIKVGGLGGAVRVIDFWASWCKNSREQLPMVEDLAQKFRRRGVDFTMVNVEEYRPAAGVIEAAKNLELLLPIALDPQRKIARAYGVRKLPTLVLIGKNGSIEAVYEGVGRTDEALQQWQGELTARIDALLEGKTRTHFEPEAKIPTDATALRPTIVGRRRARAATPTIEVEAMRQDTGRHKPGTTVEHTLYIANEGTPPLNITAVTGPEEMSFELGDDKLSIPAGESAPITVKYTAPEQVGEFVKQIRIESNDPRRSPFVMVLTGMVRPYIEVNPPTGVDFSNNPRIHNMPRLATLTYNGSEKIEYGEVTSSSPNFSANVETIGNTPYAKVTVESHPPFKKGENRGVLRIQTNCPQQPVVEVPAMLYLPDRIEVTPDQVELGSARRLQQKTVTITNNGTDSLNVLGVETSNERIRTQFFPEPDGISYRLILTFPSGFEPASEGDQVTIRTDDAQYKQIVIPIRKATAGK